MLATSAITPASVFAHAELLESDPPDGGTLTTTPHTMALTFDEPLDADASDVIVRDSAGAQVASGGLSGEDDMVMTVELPELAPGAYTVRWTAVTPDDDAVERGTVTFMVAQATVTAAPTQTAAAQTAGPTDEPSVAPPTTEPSSTPALTVIPTRAPTPGPDAPAAPTGSNDLLIALLVAGVAVGGVLAYLFLRNRS